MSFPGAWLFSSMAQDGNDVASHDSSSMWNPPKAVLRAGRELSGYLLGRSPPVSPTAWSKCDISGRSPGKSEGPLTPASFQSPGLSSVSSPIQSLPHELLKEIFEDYVHAYSRIDRSGPWIFSPLAGKGSYNRILPKSGADTSPMLLGHVCSLWRIIVLSTPSLWGTFCARSLQPCDMELFELWLTRSAQCSLNFKFSPYDPQESNVADGECNKQVLTTLLSHSHRWETARLTLHADTEPTMRVLARLSLPTLHRLELDLVGYSTEASLHVTQLFSAASNLCHIGWSGRCNLSAALPGVDWTKLTSVAFESINFSNLCAHLPCMQGLKSLSIVYLNWDPDHPISADPEAVTLPFLTSLAVEHYLDLRPLLRCLTLPSLSNLLLYSGIVSRQPDPRLGWQDFHQFVVRSGCKLESLEWHSVNLYKNAGAFFELFASSWGAIFPNLRHLAFANFFNKKVAQTVMSMKTQGISLGTLELRHCSVDPAILHEVLAAWPGLGCLTYVGKLDARLYTLSPRCGSLSLTSQSTTHWDFLRSGEPVPLS